ncbi:hypothetical protein ABH931_005066 [Streptacidiphilus sp. MAP12-33]
MLQFTENLSDRAAANAVRTRIDWKYAMGLETGRSRIRPVGVVRVPGPFGRGGRGRPAAPRYGTATARAWDRLHPRLTRRSAWIEDQNAELPILHGLLVRLTVDHLPGGRDPDPLWLWSSRTGADARHVDQLWQAYLRRFDLEHTFRLLRQTLGWTAPRLREPTSADVWTWLIIAVHTQLWLARAAAKDLRRPWERSLPADKLTPARVRRGFRNIRAKVARPAAAPKPTRPGPGRPPGSSNRTRAPRHTPGKTVKRADTLDQHYGRTR